MESYKLIFSGQVKEGRDRDVIGRFLCKFLRISESNSAKLFSGRAYALKRNLSKQQANDLYEKLENAGIITKIIRERALQEDITYQETVKKPATASEPNTAEDYRIYLGDKVLCKHCGSTLPEQHPANVKAASTEAPGNRTDNVLSNHQKGKADTAIPDIDSLDVSDWWKERFKLLHDSGAATQGFMQYYNHGLKQLPSSAPRKLMFPLLPTFFAFIIGPLVYLFKGMVRKGLFLTLAAALVATLISVFTELAGYQFRPLIVSLIGMTLVGVFYIYDYYRYKVLGETFWVGMPRWMGHAVTLILAFAVFAAIELFDSEMLDSDIDYVKSSYHEDNRQISIGRAFDSWSFCSNSNWSSNTTPRGERFVIFSCDVDPDILFETIFIHATADTLPKRGDPHLNIETSEFRVTWPINNDGTYSYGEGRLYFSWEDGAEGSVSTLYPWVLQDVFSDSHYFVTLNFGQNARMHYRRAVERQQQ